MLRQPNKRNATSKHPAASKRGAILAAARAEFAQAGLAGARTEAIAAAAGVNKALLYYYFRSKEQLYEAAVEEHFREFHDRALAVLGETGSARVILLKYVGLHFDFITARRQYASLYHQLIAAGGRPLKKLVSRYFLPRTQALARLLERGMREGEFRRADSVQTGISITALVVFYFSAAPVFQLLGQAEAYSAANLRRRKHEVLEFIRFGLFRNPQDGSQ